MAILLAMPEDQRETRANHTHAGAEQRSVIADLAPVASAAIQTAGLIHVAKMAKTNGGGRSRTRSAMCLHGHVTCTVCGAVVPDDSPKLAAWEVIAGDEAPDADLCDVCADRKTHGVLTDPLGLQCARCGRTRDDGVTHWWGSATTTANPSTCATTVAATTT